MEVHRTEGLMVGRLLGETHSKCVKIHQENSRMSLNYDELNTLVVEVESLINSQPLTYIYDDEEFISHPLTI